MGATMGDGIDDLAEAESTFGPGFDLIVGLLAVVLVALQLSRASLASALGGVTTSITCLKAKVHFLRRSAPTSPRVDAAARLKGRKPPLLRLCRPAVMSSFE